MGIRGWVYVLSNLAMPGLIKVGYSTKDPQLRIEELAGTGLPHPFVLEFDALLVEPRDIEQSVHARLKSVHEAKEFFRCSVTSAISAIREEAQRRRTTIISEYQREHASSRSGETSKPYTRATDATCRVCTATVPKNQYRCLKCYTFVM
jgi:hypothetical protein